MKCGLLFVNLINAVSILRKASYTDSVRTVSSSTTSKGPKREAVVVTLHELTPGVKGLLHELAKDVNGTHRDLYALVDSKTLTSRSAINKVVELVGGKERLVSLKYDQVFDLVFPGGSYEARNSFDEFEGMHHSPAKPGAIWWLAEGPGSKDAFGEPKYDSAWIIESDVRFKGNWSLVFESYRDESFDLVSVLDDPFGWMHWKYCTHPGCSKEGKQRSFLPIFRISKHLAQDVLETLRAGYTGHHEALLHTICAEERRWNCTSSDLEESDFLGTIAFKKGKLPGHLRPMKLYHPVKNL